MHRRWWLVVGPVVGSFGLEAACEEPYSGSSSYAHQSYGEPFVTVEEMETPPWWDYKVTNATLEGRYGRKAGETWDAFVGGDFEGTSLLVGIYTQSPEDGVVLGYVVLPMAGSASGGKPEGVLACQGNSETDLMNEQAAVQTHAQVDTRHDGSLAYLVHAVFTSAGAAPEAPIEGFDLTDDRLDGELDARFVLWPPERTRY